jgi:Fe-S cluster assembly protein SufD
MQIYSWDWQQPNLALEISQHTQLLGVLNVPAGRQVKQVAKLSHLQPNIYSRIELAVVLNAASSLDLELVLNISQAATNTDTYLKVHTLRLPGAGSARVVPSLEIKNQQVKAGHAAVVGELDSQQLYYLRSRGLSLEQAQQLVIQSFTQAINDKLSQQNAG